MEVTDASPDLKLTLKEVLTLRDPSVLFQRVISDVLLTPVTVPYIGSDILRGKIPSIPCAVPDEGIVDPGLWDSANA